MRESRTSGSVRGAARKGRPYRDTRFPSIRGAKATLAFTFSEYRQHALLPSQSVQRVSRPAIPH
jgi:hypothetical protein